MSYYSFDSKTTQLLQDYGLVANMVSWEDTARTKNSCWGPNISDMTLVTDTFRCPMIRRPNFNDVTYDLPIESFNLLVGNENNTETKVISLKEKLEELGLYLERDKVILTSAQTCVLSCEKDVDFSVQLYNYQSSDSDSRVLTIMACDKGTSIQTLGSSKEKLYFNFNGTAYDFKAERLADIREKRTGEKHQAVKKVSEMSKEEKRENVIMVFQVPLKSISPNPKRGMMLGGGAQLASAYYNLSSAPELEEDEDDEGNYSDKGAGGLYGDSSSDDDDDVKGYRRVKVSKKGVDMAVLSLGKEHGKFKGVQMGKLVRDERYPIRCTFQYYRVNDKFELEEEVIQDIKHTFDNLEKEAVSFGSLVVNTTDRTTEPDLKKTEDKKQLMSTGGTMSNQEVNWKDRTLTSFM